MLCVYLNSTFYAVEDVPAFFVIVAPVFFTEMTKVQSTKPPIDFHLEAKFEGIDVSVGHRAEAVLHSMVTG